MAFIQRHKKFGCTMVDDLQEMYLNKLKRLHNNYFVCYKCVMPGKSMNPKDYKPDETQNPFAHWEQQYTINHEQQYQ